jgi:hypothetical protein
MAPSGWLARSAEKCESIIPAWEGASTIDGSPTPGGVLGNYSRPP